MLIFLWFSLILYVDGEECDHLCSLQIDKTVYPCSTIEKRTDCKPEDIVIEKGIKRQINFTSLSKFPDSFKNGFHIVLVDAIKSTYFCYQISQSFVRKHVNQVLTIDCKIDDVNKNNKDINNKQLIATNKRKRHKREDVECVYNKLIGTFQVAKRILKFKLKENGNYLLQLFNSTGELLINLNITTNESLYLRIPEDLEILNWKLYCDNNVRKGSGTFNFSDASLGGEFSETTACIHTFPYTWTTSINLDVSRSIFLFNIHVKNIPCFEGNYIVYLYKVPSKDMNCESTSRKEVNNRTINVKSYDNEFKNCSDGFYCIRIRPIDDRCSYRHCPTLYSYETVTISGKEILKDSEVIKQEPNVVVWIIIPITVILLIAVIIVLFCLRKRIFPSKRRFVVRENSSQLADKMQEIKMASKQIILVLCCNENEKINKDIDHLIKFLEDCCFCKVLHAKTVSAHNDILKTNAMDWSTDALKKAKKTIVIITEKAYDLYKYKEVDDSNFCLFSDDTFSSGIQKLKQCQELEHIFVRFYSKDNIPLDDLMDEVIEIPQAMVHLFHCIHNKKALICDETEFIDYWMSNESFQYLHHLNEIKGITPGVTLNHDNELQKNLIPSELKNTNVSVDGNEQIDQNLRKQQGLKLTNLRTDQNRNSKKVLEGYDNNAFCE